MLYIIESERTLTTELALSMISEAINEWNRQHQLEHDRGVDAKIFEVLVNK